MLFRLILLLAIAGALAVFTVQNLTPLLPLVFLGIRFPALPLAWWVLGAIGLGVASMLTIQVLFGLSNFVAGQSVRSKVRNSNRATGSNRWATSPLEPDSAAANRTTNRRDRSSSTDDAAWQDWRGYESSSSSTPPRTTAPVDDWERPLSDDWETATPSDRLRDRSTDRISPDDLQNFEVNSAPKRSSQAGSSYSYSYRDPQATDVGKTEAVQQPEPVVDADYRVIVPPYRSLDEMIPPPPPPPVEENADDWFEDTPDEFGDSRSQPKPGVAE